MVQIEKDIRFAVTQKLKDNEVESLDGCSGEQPSQQTDKDN